MYEGRDKSRVYKFALFLSLHTTCRFKVKWLDRTPIGGIDYSKFENVQANHANGVLPDEAYRVLCGVHQRRGLSLAENLSDGDITFLIKCYGMTFCT